jgi:hypothetical protein
MNDMDFFACIVIPTVEDFSRNPENVRLGVLACLVLQAMCDHYFHHNQSNASKVGNCANRHQFRAEAARNDRAFDQIMHIANGTKHAKKSFFDLHHEIPGAYGVMRFGFPMTSEKYVFMDDDNTWPLYLLTELVAKAWKSKLGLPI